MKLKVMHMLEQRKVDQRLLQNNCPNCTKPKPKKKKQMFNSLALVHRNNEWEAQKKAKLALARKEKASHVTDGCTFHPKINKRPKSS